MTLVWLVFVQACWATKIVLKYGKRIRTTGRRPGETAALDNKRDAQWTSRYKKNSAKSSVAGKDVVRKKEQSRGGTRKWGG